MKKKNSQWKECERRFASMFGGTRQPISGRIRDEGIADIEVKSGVFSHLSFEVKFRKSLPSWLFDNAFDQADKAKKEIKKYSTVLLHQKGHKYEDAFVLMRASDFIEFVKSLNENNDKVY